MSEKSAGSKFIVSVCWDAKGMLLIDYFFMGWVILGKYYTKLLNKLVKIFNKKDVVCGRKKFHYDNAFTIAVGKLN